MEWSVDDDASIHAFVAFTHCSQTLSIKMSLGLLPITPLCQDNSVDPLFSIHLIFSTDVCDHWLRNRELIAYRSFDESKWL